MFVIILKKKAELISLPPLDVPQKNRQRSLKITQGVINFSSLRPRSLTSFQDKMVVPIPLSMLVMVLGQLPPGQLPPGQLPPDNYPPDNYPLGQIPPGQLPPQITEFPKHKSTKFTSHKVYKSQKVHKLRGQSHNIYEYKFYKIQVSTKVVHGYGKLWSFGAQENGCSRTGPLKKSEEPISMNQ